MKTANIVSEADIALLALSAVGIAFIFLLVFLVADRYSRKPKHVDRRGNVIEYHDSDIEDENDVDDNWNDNDINNHREVAMFGDERMTRKRLHKMEKRRLKTERKNYEQARIQAKIKRDEERLSKQLERIGDDDSDDDNDDIVLLHSLKQLESHQVLDFRDYSDDFIDILQFIQESPNRIVSLEAICSVFSISTVTICKRIIEYLEATYGLTGIFLSSSIEQEEKSSHQYCRLNGDELMRIAGQLTAMKSFTLLDVENVVNNVLNLQHNAN